MSKVKIVQVCMAATGGEWDTLYLDDQGRVWRDNGYSRRAGAHEDGRDYYEWVPAWEEIDLPNEIGRNK